MDLTIPVIGIIRGIKANFFGPLMDAAFSAGLQAKEVTFNTQHAEAIVADMVSQIRSGKYLGMGTLRNQEGAKRAVGAGAMFLVTPNFDSSWALLIKYRWWRWEGLPAIMRGEYFKAGAKAVGVGASLFGKEAMDRQTQDDIAINVEEFIRRSVLPEPNQIQQ